MKRFSSQKLTLCCPVHAVLRGVRPGPLAPSSPTTSLSPSGQLPVSQIKLHFNPLDILINPAIQGHSEVWNVGNVHFELYVYKLPGKPVHSIILLYIFSCRDQRRTVTWSTLDHPSTCTLNFLRTKFCWNCRWCVWLHRALRVICSNLQPHSSRYYNNNIMKTWPHW